MTTKEEHIHDTMVRTENKNKKENEEEGKVAPRLPISRLIELLHEDNELLAKVDGREWKRLDDWYKAYAVRVRTALACSTFVPD